MKHISSQFDYMETDWLWTLNSILYFSKSLLWFRRDDQTWVVTNFVEKESVLSHVFRVYCHPSWSLVVQCVMHLCICYAKSPMNTKAVYIITECSQFTIATDDLKLLRQISNVRLLLKKRHTYLSFFFFFYGRLFIGSLIRTFMWNRLPLMCRVWLRFYTLVLLLNTLILFRVGYLS